MKLNLGCGNDYKEGYINVDVNHSVKCDATCDLSKPPFPWQDGSIDFIVAKHIVEHLWDKDKFMNECWRILKSGGELYIETPTAGTKAFYKDPQHVSGWIEETFRYYADWNTCPANERKSWIIESVYTTLKGDENEFITARLKKP